MRINTRLIAVCMMILLLVPIVSARIDYTETLGLEVLKDLIEGLTRIKVDMPATAGNEGGDQSLALIIFVFILIFAIIFVAAERIPVFQKTQHPGAMKAFALAFSGIFIVSTNAVNYVEDLFNWSANWAFGSMVWFIILTGLALFWRSFSVGGSIAGSSLGRAAGKGGDVAGRIWDKGKDTMRERSDAADAAREAAEGAKTDSDLEALERALLNIERREVGMGMENVRLIKEIADELEKIAPYIDNPQYSEAVHRVVHSARSKIGHLASRVKDDIKMIKRSQRIARSLHLETRRARQHLNRLGRDVGRLRKDAGKESDPKRKAEILETVNEITQLRNLIKMNLDKYRDIEFRYVTKLTRDIRWQERHLGQNLGRLSDVVSHLEKMKPEDLAHTGRSDLRKAIDLLRDIHTVTEKIMYDVRREADGIRELNKLSQDRTRAQKKIRERLARLAK